MELKKNEQRIVPFLLSFFFCLFVEKKTCDLNICRRRWIVQRDQIFHALVPFLFVSVVTMNLHPLLVTEDDDNDDENR